MLALDLYFRVPEARQSKSHPEVAKLSEVLRALPLSLDRPDPEKFRNVNGVFLKLQNFKAVDPEYTADGRVGMTAGATSREQALSDRFADRQGELRQRVEQIRRQSLAIGSSGRRSRHPQAESEPPAARSLLTDLVGQTILTVGRPQPNTILEVGENSVLVGTKDSPTGSPVPIRLVQDALDRLAREGEVEISVESLGHRRSSFIGAVLLTVPGTRAATSPLRIVASTDVASEYRAAVAGDINAWWEDDPDELFWLEITDRDDIGVDLHAPQRDARGATSPGYSLVWWVNPGDVVFHYDRNARAIASWSRAVGQVEEAPVVWLPHRAASRRRLGVPRAQPGWWLDLDGPYPLSQPLSLAVLRSRGEDIRRVLNALRATRDGSLYFPFFFYRDSELRPMQPYLNKLPSAAVRALPELGEAIAGPAEAGTTAPATRRLGSTYRHAAVSELPIGREPFSVDPSVVERGLRGHADTQNALATAVGASGSDPRSPRPDEPSFDLAWDRDDVIYVAEVKSTTESNEERQLRLGLGQVLRYRDLIRAQTDRDVRAVLVVEREPRDPSWQRLCSGLGVILTYPPEFDALDL